MGSLVRVQYRPPKRNPGTTIQGFSFLAQEWETTFLSHPNGILGQFSSVLGQNLQKKYIDKSIPIPIIGIEAPKARKRLGAFSFFSKQYAFWSTHRQWHKIRAFGERNNPKGGFAMIKLIQREKDTAQNAQRMLDEQNRYWEGLSAEDFQSLGPENADLL
jgi:hypothetical protein